MQRSILGSNLLGLHSHTALFPIQPPYTTHCLFPLPYREIKGDRVQAQFNTAQGWFPSLITLLLSPLRLSYTLPKKASLATPVQIFLPLWIPIALGLSQCSFPNNYINLHHLILCALVERTRVQSCCESLSKLLNPFVPLYQCSHLHTWGK